MLNAILTIYGDLNGLAVTLGSPTFTDITFVHLVIYWRLKHCETPRMTREK